LSVHAHRSTFRQQGDRCQPLPRIAWLEGGEDWGDLFNPRIYATSRPPRRIATTLTVSGEEHPEKARRRRYAGLGDTPRRMIHALRRFVVDGTSWIDECGTVKFDEEILHEDRG
jgi:hypothetical protein